MSNGNGLPDEGELIPIQPIEKIKRPVVVVPGILGSDLFNKRRRVWPPVDGQGNYDAKAISKLNPTQNLTPDDGPIFKFCYGPLLNALRMMGYDDNPPPGQPKTLWVFPYDWTQSCFISGRKLKHFIVTKILPSATPHWKDVDVVNHSMGGIVTRAAKQLLGAPIKRSAYLASPHNGAVNAYLALHPDIGLPFFGEYLDPAVDTIIGFIFQTLGPLKLLHAQATRWDSAYDLLPDDKYLLPAAAAAAHPMVNIVPGFAPGGGPLHTTQTIYFKNRFSRFPGALWPAVRRALAFKRRLAPLPTEKYLVIFCSKKVTKDQIDYDLLRRFGFPFFPLLMPGFTTARDTGQGGDGTVNTDSANPPNAVPALPVNGFHVSIPSLRSVHVHLRAFLGGP